MHAKAAVVAEAQGKSLNQWLTETIEKAAAAGSHAVGSHAATTIRSS